MNFETQMNQEKGLGLQSQCPFFQKMLGTAVPDHFLAIVVKNVDREMGQICNISFWPLFTIKLGKKCENIPALDSDIQDGIDHLGSRLHQKKGASASASADERPSSQSSTDDNDHQGQWSWRQGRPEKGRLD